MLEQTIAHVGTKVTKVHERRRSKQWLVASKQ